MSVTSALTVGTHEVATELGHAVHELVTHQIDVDEFTRRFLASRVYTLCPVRPGPFVMSRPGGAAIVPVWSTVRALGLFFLTMHNELEELLPQTTQLKMKN